MADPELSNQGGGEDRPPHTNNLKLKQRANVALVHVKGGLRWHLSNVWRWEVVVIWNSLLFGIGVAALYADQYVLAASVFLISIGLFVAKVIHWVKGHEHYLGIGAIAFVLGALAYAGCLFLIQHRRAQVAIQQRDAAHFTTYRIKVFLKDEHGSWVDNAEIKTSVDSNRKKGDGWWEIDVPQANKPLGDIPVEISAINPDEYLQGTGDVLLGSNPNPEITITMTRDRSEYATGKVVDELSKAAIPLASVYVEGYEDQPARTGPNGKFLFPAHAAHGELIRIDAEKTGYRHESVVAYAGVFKEIKLSRSRR